MALEIERKFLVIGTPWLNLPQGDLMRQGYLIANEQKVVRVRVEGQNALLTIKSGNQGLTRGEWEYPIPLSDATQLLTLCDAPLIEKYRYRILFENNLWELDVFMGANAGLVVAEIELQSEDQTFSKPAWVGAEVTHDKRYLNAHLQKNPYSEWK